MAQEHLESDSIIKIACVPENVIPACRESFLRNSYGQAAMTGQGIAQYALSPYLPPVDEWSWLTKEVHHVCI
jgi:hypothetical protein